MKRTIRVLISGGGTGGHIFPAISIANAIKVKSPDAEILFVGADNRMEMEKVPAAGYPIKGLPVSGFNRSNPLANFKVLWRLWRSLRMARRIVRDFRPDVAVGVGGYASGPTLWAAAHRGVPTLIQEQNSYAGVTNKLLASKAHTICVAYDGMERFFPAEKLVLTGNPVRQDLCNEALTRTEAAAFFGLDPNKKIILLIGGSLGALTLNTAVAESIPEIVKSGVQLICNVENGSTNELKWYWKQQAILLVLNKCRLSHAWIWPIRQPIWLFREREPVPYRSFVYLGSL